MMCHPTQDDDAAAGVQRQGDNGGKTANKNLVMAALSRCLGQQKNQKEMTPYLPKIRTLTKFLCLKVFICGESNSEAVAVVVVERLY